MVIFVFLKKIMMSTGILIFLLAAGIITGNDSKAKDLCGKRPRNIVLMIGDGMGLAQIYAGMTANHGHLNIERFKYTGLAKTWSATDYITDSGASGTAMATGQKTYNNAIGVGTDSLPCRSILEYAEDNGLFTGLIATSSIVHATPASFIAHQKHRNMYESIATDLVNSGIDVFIGGGRNYFEKRSDSINLTDSLIIRDYQIAYDTNELKMCKPGKIAAMLANNHLPSISEGRGNMFSLALDKAIGILSENNKGFFLMAEGSQIDWACHANDTNNIILELLDFDKAVGKALDFAARDKNTLVIVTADHETSGLALTNGDFQKGWVEMRFASHQHSGIPVPVFAYGPGAESFSGFYENTDIFQKMMQLFGFIH
ncbi:MAG: alkaline phosphatase [Bacteroidales bacterium]|nr:alkaline phosphatase [Bacteroidales bacterium]